MMANHAPSNIQGKQTKNRIQPIFGSLEDGHRVGFLYSITLLSNTIIIIGHHGWPKVPSWKNQEEPGETSTTKKYLEVLEGPRNTKKW